MSFSNYRIIQYANEQGEVYFQIQQVGYDVNGVPKQLGDMNQMQAQSVEALKNVLIHQMAALTLPALDSKIFNKKSTHSAEDTISMIKTKDTKTNVQS